MPNNTLQIPQGDTFAIDFTFTSNGTPVDITGYKVYFSAKKNKTDIVPVISFNWDPVTGGGFDTTQGQTQYVMAPALTQDVTPDNYWYDLKLVDVSGDIAHSFAAPLEIVQTITT